MKGIFRRVFYLYAGEGRNAFLFVSLAFIWALGGYCGLTLSDGLFLELVGYKSLPIAYLLIACGLFISATLFLYLIKRCTPGKLFKCVLLLGAFGYGLFGLFNQFAHGEYQKIYWFSAKVFANIFFILLTTCYWFFLDQYYNLQNAKRLYSLFNAAIFFGNAVGAGVLSITLDHVGESLLFSFIIGCLIATFIALLFIDKCVKSTSSELDDESLAGFSFKTMVQSIWKSKFTLLLMATYFLIQLLSFTTEYNYMEGLKRHFGSSSGNDLTVFLGQSMAWIALFNMIFGLFCYSRLINRFGVNNITLISPIFFFITFGGWSLSDTLLCAVIGVIAVEGVSYLIDENNSNLLLSAVPVELKSKVRIAIDSFFEPLGMTISALMVLFVPCNPTILGLLLSLLTLGVVVALRLHYRGAVLSLLTKNSLHIHFKPRDWLKSLSKKERKQTEFRLITILRKEDEASQLMAFEMLLNIKNIKVLPRLLNHLSGMSFRAKLKAIALLEKSAFAKTSLVIESLHRMAHEMSHPALKSAIHFYLASLGLLQPTKIEHDLKSPDLMMKGAAIVALRRAPNWHLEAAMLLQQLLHSTHVKEICMGLKILSFDGSSIQAIIPFLSYPHILVARQAAESLQNVIVRDDESLSHVIIERLSLSSDPTYRISLIRAFGKMNCSPDLTRKLILASTHFRPQERRCVEEVIVQMGLTTVPTLLSLIKDVTVHERCRLLAGKTLNRVAPAELRANLYELIVTEVERAYFYFYHYYGKLGDQSIYPLVQEALSTGYHSIIDFIIQLLGAAGSIEQSELLTHALRSKNPKARGHAIETLENTCDTKIFRLIRPLIDDRPLEDKLRVYVKQGRPIYSLDELLDWMTTSYSALDRVVATTLKSRLKQADTVTQELLEVT